MYQDYKEEARLITRYLLSEPLGKPEEDRYVNAMKIIDLQLSEYEKKLVVKMFKNTFRLSCIDAGLALLDPSNQVRRKIFTMLAILEASPNYTKYFIARNFSIWYNVKIIFIGVRAIFRAILGVLMVKKVQRGWL